MLCAYAAFPRWENFRLSRDETFQRLDIFVVDITNVFRAEVAVGGWCAQRSHKIIQKGISFGSTSFGSSSSKVSGSSSSMTGISLGWASVFAGSLPVAGWDSVVIVALGPSWNRSAIISVRHRFWPSGAFHDRVWRRPSMKRRRPRLRYSRAISACLPHMTILWNSVCSCFCPERSLNTRFVARRKLTTGMPDGVIRASGSLTTLPRRKTRLRNIRWVVYGVGLMAYGELMFTRAKGSQEE